MVRFVPLRSRTRTNPTPAGFRVLSLVGVGIGGAEFGGVDFVTVLEGNRVRIAAQGRFLGGHVVEEIVSAGFQPLFIRRQHDGLPPGMNPFDVGAIRFSAISSWSRQFAGGSDCRHRLMRELQLR